MAVPHPLTPARRLRCGDLPEKGEEIMTWVPALPASSAGFTFAVTLGVAVALLIAAVVVSQIISREQKKHY
jgi:hypothetical protein